MIELVGVHGFNECKLVGDCGQMWDRVGDPGTGPAALAKGLRCTKQLGNAAGKCEPLAGQQQLDAGMLVTRHVTSGLNLVGFGTLSAWSVLIGLEVQIQPLWARRGRIFCLVVALNGLVFLAILHMRMDRHLDSQGVRDFKPFHRLYLMVSTVQWVANMAIVAFTIRLWTGWKKFE